MPTVLWMTIDRHPESLQGLIREQLAGMGWDVLEVSYDRLEELNALPLEQVDAVLLAPARYFPPSNMDRLTSCKLMQIWSSGYDKFNLRDAQDRGITVANNHGSNAIAVAEHTLLMMLGVARRVPEMHNRVITGEWAGNDHGMSSHSLSGKTLGLVGLGNIGTLVAQRAQAFGMEIIFADPAFSDSSFRNWEKVDFDHLLANSDFITLHVHLEPATKHLINSENIGLLLKRPFVINVSRADLIEREALEKALDSQQIRGVALDAHYEEPTRASDSLMGRRNVFFSPHVAGSTVDSYRQMLAACIGNIGDFLEKGTLRGEILP